MEKSLVYGIAPKPCRNGHGIEHRIRVGKKRNLVCSLCNRLKRIKDSYGVSEEVYKDLLERQFGKCAICGASWQASGRRFSVDHSHETGKVRGLLCGSCNFGLGQFKDDPDLLMRAVGYLMASRGNP